MIEFEIFSRPNGNRKVSEITAIHTEDAMFFRQYGIRISAESFPPGKAIFYFDYGERDDEGEPVELAGLVNLDTDNPYEFFAKIRKELSTIMGLLPEEVSNG